MTIAKAGSITGSTATLNRTTQAKCDFKNHSKTSELKMDNNIESKPATLIQ